MTFNIRGSCHAGDGINAWGNRAALNVETIKHHAPVLIGFQELQSGNLDTYRKMLPEYGYVLGPEAGNEPPHEFNAIFFDPARLAVLESGGFWLSTTPERYSSSWRTRCVRSANWVKLKCPNTGLSFLHLNTHLDHVSRRARAEGSRLILQKVVDIQEDDSPVVITGDFNCAPGSLPYRNFVEEGFADTHLATANLNTEDSCTFHAFEGPRYPATSHDSERIDWILLRDRRRRLRIESQSIVRDCDEGSGIYPSDHYPVLAELALADRRETPPGRGLNRPRSSPRRWR